MCPKVACNGNVPLFSAKCGLNPKPFGLLIAHMVRFVMMYDRALLLSNKALVLMDYFQACIFNKNQFVVDY